MIVIGIAGGTGSGKTTVAGEVARTLGPEKAAIVHQDSYYKPAPAGLTLAELRELNYDHPDAFDWPLLTAHVRALREGHAVQQPVYSVPLCDRLPQTEHLDPAPVVIVEGIMALYRPELRELMDVRVYVDAAPDERLARLVERDVRERARSADAVAGRYRLRLKPMHDAYVEPTRDYADFVVPHGGANRRAIRLLAACAERLLADEGYMKL